MDDPILIGFIGIIVVIFLVILPICNKYLSRWFCDVMGWHLKPKDLGFDGCSANGVCPRCGKFVLQDSQGNWFTSNNQKRNHHLK